MTLTEADQAVDTGVLARLRSELSDPGFEPPLLPVAALELLALTRNPNVEFRQVLELLESDPLVAARTLRVAQSPAFARGEPLRSLESAITRLGLGTLTDIFMQVSISSRVFRSKHYAEPMERLRRHSVAVAHVARLVCRVTSLPDEYAFLCGLLHDIGAAIALLTLGDPNAKNPPSLRAASSAVWECHAEAGGIVCNSWKLPPDVVWVVKSHHAPQIDGRVHPLAAAVDVADQLARLHGAGSPVEPVLDRLPDNVLELSDTSWRRLRAEAGDLLKRVTAA